MTLLLPRVKLHSTLLEYLRKERKKDGRTDGYIQREGETETQTDRQRHREREDGWMDGCVFGWMGGRKDDLYCPTPFFSNLYLKKE